MASTVNLGCYSPAASFRAAVVQASSVFFDTPATLDKAERLLDPAATGAQLVAFPEAFIGGYLCASTLGVSRDLQKYNASAIKVPGPETETLSAMAGKYKVYLVMGVIERDGHILYTTVLFFDSSGHYLGKHQKIMLTACERIIWDNGDGSTIPVFDAPIGKIGAAISMENRMSRTAMYAKGLTFFANLLGSSVSAPSKYCDVC